MLSFSQVNLIAVVVLTFSMLGKKSSGHYLKKKKKKKNFALSYFSENRV